MMIVLILLISTRIWISLLPCAKELISVPQDIQLKTLFYHSLSLTCASVSHVVLDHIAVFFMLFSSKMESDSSP